MNIDTFRRYPRSLRDAWPMDERPSALGIDGPPVVNCWAPWWVRVARRFAEFTEVYRAYRAHHGRIYAARIAFGCAFLNLPF